MEKVPIGDLDIILIDKFLVSLYPKKGDFGHKEMREFAATYSTTYEHIYYLLNHGVHIVVMSKGPFPGEEEKERFSFTEKGVLMYDLNGYKEWEKYEASRINYLRNEFFRGKVTLWFVVIAGLSALASAIIGFFTYDALQSSPSQKSPKVKVKIEELALPPQSDSCHQAVSKLNQSQVTTVIVH